MSANYGVVIPAYNAEKTLASAIASAFASGADEVVVVDDGSTDSTSAVARDSGARVLVQPNLGAAAARRAGLRLLGSDLEAVSFLDSDDRLLPSGVAAALHRLQATNCAAICGRALGVHQDASTTQMKGWQVEITSDTLLERGYGPCPPAAVVWSAEALREAMSDRVPAIWPRYAEDYELLIRGSLVGKIGTVNECVAEYALVGGKSARIPMNSVRDAEKIRSHYGRLLGLDIKQRNSRALLALAHIRAASGERRRSVRRGYHLCRSLIAHPPTLLGFARQHLKTSRTEG